MTDGVPLTGGIIAAGEGRRLRRAGWTMAKPLVPVAGVPLIELMIRNFLAAHITSLAIIVNEQARDCVEWIRSRFPHIDPTFIVKTTGSSLESFAEVAACHPVGRMVISTSWPKSFKKRKRRSAENPSSMPRTKAEIFGWSMPST